MRYIKDHHINQKQYSLHSKGREFHSNVNVKALQLQFQSCKDQNIKPSKKQSLKKLLIPRFLN